MSTAKNGIGYSPLSDKVYLGRQNKDKGMWVGDKVDITNDFIAVAFAYFEENTSREISTMGKGSNLFINVKKDKESIERTIKRLTTILSKLNPPK